VPRDRGDRAHNADAWQLLALCYQQASSGGRGLLPTGDPDQADVPEAHNILALPVRAGRKEEAEATYRRALNCGPIT